MWYRLLKPPWLARRYVTQELLKNPEITQEMIDWEIKENKYGNKAGSNKRLRLKVHLSKLGKYPFLMIDFDNPASFGCVLNVAVFDGEKIEKNLVREGTTVIFKMSEDGKCNKINGWSYLLNDLQIGGD